MNVGAQSSMWIRLRKPILGGAICACVLILGMAVWSLADGGWQESGQPLVTYEVKQADLPIVVTERGELESQVQTTLRCEVESSGSDRSGNYGTQII